MVCPPEVVRNPAPLTDAEHTEGDPVQVMVELSGLKQPAVLAVASLQARVNDPLEPPPFRPDPELTAEILLPLPGVHLPVPEFQTGTLPFDTPAFVQSARFPVAKGTPFTW